MSLKDYEEEREVEFCAYCKTQVYEDETFVTKKNKVFHIECYEEEFGNWNPTDFEEEDDEPSFYDYSDIEEEPVDDFTVEEEE